MALIWIIAWSDWLHRQYTVLWRPVGIDCEWPLVYHRWHITDSRFLRLFEHLHILLLQLILSFKLLLQAERQHVTVHLLLGLREVSDLFPYFDILVRAVWVSLCVISHKLQILCASILLKAREDAHRNVVSDVLKNLFPSIDCAFQLEDVSHALLNCLFAHRYGPPERLEWGFISVQVINVVFVGSNFFLSLSDYLLDMLDAVDWLLQPLEIVDFSLDPRDDVCVGVAKTLGQILHCLLVIFVLRVRNDTLLLVTARVEINSSQLILCQLIKQCFYSRVNIDC